MEKFIEIEARIRANAPYNNPEDWQINYKRSNHFTDDYIIGYYEIVKGIVPGFEKLRGSLDCKNLIGMFTDSHVKMRKNTGDILIGFYAPDGPSSFSFQSSSFIDIPVKLSAGEFKFAINDKYTLPTIRPLYTELFFENIKGKTYVVYAHLNETLRNKLNDISYHVGNIVCKANLIGIVSEYATEPVFLNFNRSGVACGNCLH